MIHHLWSHKRGELIAAILMVACIVAVLAVGFTSPEPVTSAALGPDWQCSRVGFVVTTCSRIQRTEPPSVQVRKEQGCPQRRT